MNELTTQVAESDFIEGTFRNAEDPPPVERVEARGYATLPRRPSPPPPRPPRVQQKKKPISPYVPDWYCYMCYVMVVVVVLFFIAILHL